VRATAPLAKALEGIGLRRVIGMDIHRTFAEVGFWQDGRLRWPGRVDMTRAGREGFGRSLTKTDEVVLEATGNAMAVVRVLRPYVARVIIADPLQVKAIARAHVKTDKIDAGVLASLHAAGFLPEVWLPDAGSERRRRLVARRCLRLQREALRSQEMMIAAQAERAYPHFVGQSQPRPTMRRRTTNNAAGSRGAPRQPG
jgi:transposase